MNTREFIKRIRDIGRRNGVAVEFDPRKGKGSHGLLSYGNRHTTVPDKADLRLGTVKSMIKALGLEGEF